MRLVKYFFLAPALFLFISVIFYKNHLLIQQIIFSNKQRSIELTNHSKIASPSATPNSKFSVLNEPKKKETPKTENNPTSQSNAFCLNVPVLQYHHIEPREQAEKLGHRNLYVSDMDFENQMKYLLDHSYRFISAEELVQSLVQHRTLPGKNVVVTIDDGYDDNYKYAFPIAKKYGLILNLMIPTGLIENPGYLTWANLKEMVSSGLVRVYNHTWSHYSLTNGDKAKIQMEILTAKTQLEEQLGKPVTIVAYPYGSFNQQVIEVLQNNGFRGGFSTVHSFWQCDTLIFTLHRNHIGNGSLSLYGL